MYAHLQILIANTGNLICFDSPVSQQDPAKTVQSFIDLIQRHEQAFYNFVHKVHSKGEGLFDSLMRWIEQFLTLMRDGLGDRVSLEFLLPHKGEERAEIMAEVDAVARYHYSLKVIYEAKVRRRFGRTAGQSEADAEDEEAAALVDSVVKDLSFGELVSEDADELAAQESDEDSGSDEDEDDESGSTDDDDSDDDDDSEESGSSEEESGESTTEGEFRRTTPTPSLARSNTVGHSPMATRPPRQPMPKQSLDLPSPSRQSTLPIRNSQTTPGSARTRFPPSSSSSSSSTFSTSSNKKLPSVPSPNYTPQGKQTPVKVQSAVKKKKAEGPKPPELHHIPKLLPLFVEMVSICRGFFLA